MSADTAIGVLWLIRGLGPGGAERLLVAHACAGSADFRYEVAYQVAEKDQLVGELEAAGVVVHRLAGPTWPLALRRLAAERHIDVVHSHSPVMAVGARLAFRVLPGRDRPRLVYTEHNRWEAYRPLTRYANAATFALDHETLAVSEEARGSVSDRLRGRVETVHHGIDAASVRAAAGDRLEVRRALGVEPDAPLVVQVANYRREKAHEVMVAAGRILADEGNPVRIILVGQGPLQGEVEALIEAEGLGASVQVLGFRDDVAAVLAASDALVLSSDHEGLPVAVMEAFALGVPVVSTGVGGIPEAVTDGVEGLLVPPRDPVALAGAIARVTGDPDLRRTLGEGAARRAVAFDAATVTAGIEERYRAVVAAR
ncbi:MAG: glycosyltransferase [Acidimicrobiales bacterium]|nr:glycosyltransferase [Acidimicrobiales bacterium]